MNLADLLRRARERLDDTVAPGLWSDDQLIGFINDAVRQACIRKRLILDATTTDVCVVAIKAGEPKLPLHPRVLAVRTVRTANTRRPLGLTTLKVMDRERPEWPFDSGEPERVILDRDSGTLFLHPKPDKDDTLQLTVWRLPLEEEELEDGDDEPVVDEGWHIDLLDWVEFCAYSVPDVDIRDPARADAAVGRFTAKFGRLPSAHEIKCWGISPPRGQRARFI